MTSNNTPTESTEFAKPVLSFIEGLNQKGLKAYEGKPIDMVEARTVMENYTAVDGDGNEVVRQRQAYITYRANDESGKLFCAGFGMDPISGYATMRVFSYDENGKSSTSAVLRAAKAKDGSTFFTGMLFGARVNAFPRLNEVTAKTAKYVGQSLYFINVKEAPKMVVALPNGKAVAQQ